MSQPVGYQYKSRIPSLSDDASIVEALRVYHYGVDNYTTQPIPDDSIEGNFRTLHNEVDTINSLISAIPGTYLEQVSSSASPNVITGQGTTTTPLTIRSITSQTSPLIQFENSSSAGIGSVTTAGNMNLQGYLTVGSTTQSTTTGINVVIGNSTHKGVVIRGQSSQTENLQEWQNSSGTVLSSVDSSGAISAISVSVSGNQQLDSFRTRNMYVATTNPTGGNDGDVWLVYV